MNRRLALEPLELRTMLAFVITPTPADPLPGQLVDWEIALAHLPPDFTGVEAFELAFVGSFPFDQFTFNPNVTRVFDGDITDGNVFATFDANQTVPVLFGTVSGLIPLDATPNQVFDLTVNHAESLILQGPAPGTPIPLENPTPGSVTVAGPTNNVTAQILPVLGTLDIDGDAQDNDISVHVAADGVVVVTGNNGTTINGMPSVSFSGIPRISIFTGSGNNTVTVTGVLSNLMSFQIFGGAGDDMVDTTGATGGTVETTLGAGNDTLVGGPLDDSIIWNNGDGSDAIDGGGGENSVQVNGDPTGDDHFNVTADATRLLFQRIKINPVTTETLLEIFGIRRIEVNSQGGNDTFDLHDLTGTGVQWVNLDGGDGNDAFNVNQGFTLGAEPNGLLDGGNGTDALNLHLMPPPFVNLIGGAGTVPGLGDVVNIENVMGTAVPTNNVTARNAGGVLTITGDTQDNNISVFVGLTGVDVTGNGGTNVNGNPSATFSNVFEVIVATGNGNDSITVAGAVDQVDNVNLLGGDGDDAFDTTGVLSGVVKINPGFGNDSFLGGPADESLIWNNGDGSDTLHGGGGNNSVQVNGDPIGDDFLNILADGNRLLFQKTDKAPTTILDITGFQTLEVNGLGGDDTFIVGDLGKDMPALKVNGLDGDDLFIIKQGFTSGGPPGPQGDFNGGEGLDTIDLTDVMPPPRITVIDGVLTLEDLNVDIFSIEHFLGGIQQNVILAQLFYNGSAFDGNNPAGNAADVNAIDTGKVSLEIGQAATFANISGFTKGITGVTFLLTDLPSDGANLTPADFAVRLGTTANVNSWTAGPAPMVTVLPNSGPAGEDRVLLTFAEGAIRDTYAAFEMLATPNTGLTQTHRAIFGNVAGDAGGSFLNPVTHFGRDASDLQRQADPSVLFQSSVVTTETDVNKDGLTNGSDFQGTVTGGVFNQFNINLMVLPVITPQVGTARRAAPAPGFAAAATDAAVAAGAEYSAIDEEAGSYRYEEGGTASGPADERVGGERKTDRELAFAAIGEEPVGSLIDLIGPLVEEPFARQTH